MARRKINPDTLPSNNREQANLPPKPKVIAVGKTKGKRSLSHEVRTIINDLFLSVVVPSTKSMIYEFLKDMLGQMILGPNAPKNARGLPGHQAYHSIYNSVINRARPMTSLGRPQTIPQIDVAHQDVYFDHEQDARLVLAAMLDRLARYGRVSLGDMRHLSGLTTNATHQRYFWMDLSSCDIILTSDGWVITLPDLQYK